MKRPSFLIPTVFVTAAAATMVGLGVWQLQRAQWKNALLARYERAASLPAIAWSAARQNPEQYYFRKTMGFCPGVTGWQPVAGRNVKGDPGWSFLAQCSAKAKEPGMTIDMGWSRQSRPPLTWQGGIVSGVAVPDKNHAIRLVSTQPAPGLQPSAPPVLDDIANNHLFYAFQWFFFAAAALFIYARAWRQRKI